MLYKSTVVYCDKCLRPAVSTDYVIADYSGGGKNTHIYNRCDKHRKIETPLYDMKRNKGIWYRWTTANNIWGQSTLVQNVVLELD